MLNAVKYLTAPADAAGGKLLIAFIFASLLLTSLFYSQTNTFKLGFTGAYPNYFDTTTETIDWSFYSELNLNTIQGWWIGDNPFGLRTLSDMGSNNMDGYFQPDSLRRAGYGRVQINQAEETSGYFYYDEHHSMGSDVPDMGYTVRRYLAPSSPGLVLSEVKENGFQSLTAGPYDPMYQVGIIGPGGGRPVNRYYVKPRMRVNTSDVSGTNKEVIKIIVYRFNGSTTSADSLTIYTNDFKNSMGTYDGSYLEEFRDNNFSIAADLLNTGRPNNHDPANLSSCKVDYQIYWYGTVSVWIDYVKVMDEAANRLLGSQETVIRHMLRSQIKRLNESGQDLHEIKQSFYRTGYDYCNIECLNFIIRLLKEETERGRNEAITYMP